MLSLSLNVNRESAFLGMKKTLAILAEFKPGAGGAEIPISNFLEELFSASPDFIPSICFDNPDGEQTTLIEDLRGRPADAFADTERSASDPLRRLQEEEIFFSDGVILPTEDSKDSDGAEIPFYLRVSSKFETFKDNKHIVYRIMHNASPALDEIKSLLSAKMLARLLPLRLDKIRLGLENYRTKKFSSMFGSAPSVSDTLYLEITRTSIKLTAASEFSGKNVTLPFAEQRLLPHFGAALKKCGLFPNFLERVQTEI